jgi:hypothetical protein
MSDGLWRLSYLVTPQAEAAVAFGQNCSGFSLPYELGRIAPALKSFALNLQSIQLSW